MVNGKIVEKLFTYMIIISNPCGRRESEAGFRVCLRSDSGFLMVIALLPLHSEELESLSPLPKTCKIYLEEIFSEIIFFCPFFVNTLQNKVYRLIDN